MIDVKNLSKSFGSNLVLDDISEHIYPGEKVVIIGPSGSGKSTFLRCLNLLETPSAGTITVDGAEIIRGGLMSLDPGQMEAGRSLGLNYIDTMRFIVIPQAFKAILPSLGNEFITLLKDTALIYTIGGEELLYAAKAISSRTYEQMFPLMGTAIIYLVLVLIFSWLQSLLERRLRQSDRR